MLQLRISSGTVKNKKLKTPEIPEFKAVQEIVKQAIFAILGQQTANATCLDLFAGSGNMGLEALSRGASHCDFVDNHNLSIEALNENIKFCDFESQTEIFRKDTVKFAAAASTNNKTYDIIFMDPFYKDTAQIHLLKLLQNLLKPAGTLIIIYGEALNLDTIIDGTNFEVITTRKFGASRFSVLKQNLQKSK